MNTNTIVPNYGAVSDRERHDETVALMAEVRALRVETERLDALVWAIGRRSERPAGTQRSGGEVPG